MPSPDFSFSKQVHITIHSKGGVGKTMLAAKIAERLLLLGTAPVCIDTDTYNNDLGLRSYKALNVQSIALLSDGEIQANAFDTMYRRVLQADGPFVIDIGASSFTEFVSYARDMDLVSDLQDRGFTVVFHIIIAGNTAGVKESASSFARVASAFPRARNFLWFNQFDGDIVDDAGVPFHESKIYLALEKQILGHHVLPRPKKGRFDTAIQLTKERGMLCSQAEASPAAFGIDSLEARRVYQWSRDFFAGVDVLQAFLQAELASGEVEL